MGPARSTHRAPAGGGRLDTILVRLYPDQSRARLQSWIEAGHVWVEGRRASKAGARLRGGESIAVDVAPPPQIGPAPEPIPLEIVYEDSDLIVVNKPAGMVVHPAAGHDSGTLVNAVLAHARDLAGIGGEVRPGIVHRLDRDTSGLIVVAKSEPALRWLQSQFRDREVEKVYLALVDGAPPDRQGRIEAPVGREVRHRQRMGIVPASRGRQATTDYRTLEAFERHTLLEVRPRTGRTHQIRIHLAFLGCPVTGDRVYGARRPTLDAGRQMLHAWRLAFRLPGHSERREFEAAVPPDMATTIEQARGGVELAESSGSARPRAGRAARVGEKRPRSSPQRASPPGGRGVGC